MTQGTNKPIPTDRHTLIARTLIVGAFVFCVLGVKYLSDWTRPEHRPDLLFAAINDKAELITVERLPLTPGQSFGWLLRTRTDAPVRWKEEFTVYPTKDSLQSQPDARPTTITEKTEQPRPTDKFGQKYYGALSNFWAITPDDPPGTYHFKVYIDNWPPKEYRFELYAPAPQ